MVYYPNEAMSINAFRAYFELLGGLECGEPTTTRDGINIFVLNFGEDATDIVDLTSNPAAQGLGNSNALPQIWYLPDGRRLSSKPTVKGVYIFNGHQVVIK